MTDESFREYTVDDTAESIRRVIPDERNPVEDDCETMHEVLEGIRNDE